VGVRKVEENMIGDCEMVKKLKVDVNASLGFQANGRLKPADKAEYADKNIKRFECPECNHHIEMGKMTFGEGIICPNCGETMIRVY
jgi:predicted RNA-binding Zn-ribbon protein involved in translation (DUF1610 family)